MKTKQLTLYLVFLSVLFGFANTDKYRIMIMDDPSSTITIGWNQINGTGAMVYYDTVDHGTNHLLYSNSQAVDRSVSFKGMNNQYVRLAGLLPNTNYYFIIKDSNSTSQRFWFRTAPDDNSRLSFVAGGDSRTNRTPRLAANSLVPKLKPHAVFFGGDMTNGNTDNEWKQWFDDWQLTIASDGRMFPVIPARGNHETSYSGPVTIYNLFDTPNSDSYYAVTFGNDLIRAYTLNSEISVLGDQQTWLVNDLANASPNIKWKMAQYHKPIRPHTAWKPENNNQYNAWAQLFYDEGVRLVVECDSHMTKTTWPVMPSSGPDNDEGFVIEQTKGTVYTGEGCWGAPLRPNDDDKSWTRNSDSFNQFKLLFVEESKIELRTINVNNASSVGEVSNTDPFTLPANLDVFNPPTGSVVTISNHLDSSCPPVNTPCDDGDSSTFYSVEDGACNCVGLDESLVDVFTMAIDKESDDAEEQVFSGTVRTDSRSLELVEDANNQIVGVRFNNIEIPDGATLLQAYIQFTSRDYNTYKDPANLEIHGELSPNSSTFTTANYNISSRPRTSSSVLWSNVKRWGSNGIAGFYERSPNVVDIVNEIKDQPGWTIGNSMTFMFSGSGKRVANAFRYGTPASLKIIYLHNCPIIKMELGAQDHCDPSNDTYDQDITLTYVHPPSTGHINVNGQLFPIGTSPQTITLTGLYSDGFEVDVTAFFTDDDTCKKSEDRFFEAPTICSLGNIPDNIPDDNINLALRNEATLSGSVSGQRGPLNAILYDPSIQNYYNPTQFNEYGVNYGVNIGIVDIDDAFKWQVNWQNVKYINYITFGGVYPPSGASSQLQPYTLWEISYRLDGNWIVLDQGQGGWIDSGIYEWGGGTKNPIEADALRVKFYSDGEHDVISIHLRGRGGTSTYYADDSATTPKATLIQYLAPGNSCGITIPAGSILYCDDTWIYTDGPDETSGAKNAIIASGTYTIGADKAVEVKNLEILSGATVIVKEGASLAVNGNLVNNGSLLLESISTKYSSLIIEGTSTGNASYKRHVNAYNGSTGNDLISSPFTGQNFGDFSTANPNIYENPNNSNEKLFGPFNELTGSYEIYHTTTHSNTPLDKGVGYRAARDITKDGTNGTTLTFTGIIETGGFSIPITETTATSFSGWNLIGNPYPSYMDFETFFNHNKSALDLGVYQALYGYDGNASNGWTILNNLSFGQFIAPGQGFFIKVKPGGGTISFTPEMRVKGSSDDFILGRSTLNSSSEGHIKLEIDNNINSRVFNTAIYFNENASLGLDPGYDAALFGGTAPEFSIYSNLVEENSGAFMAIQAIGTSDINSTIPIGVNAMQGQDITIRLAENTLPSSTKVYLEDVLNHTFTLLTEHSYTFTALNNISGTGRFYLRFEDVVLNSIEQSLNNLNIYTNSIEKTISIKGQLETHTNFKLYDLNGKVVTYKALDRSSTIQTIDVAQLSVGIYIVELISNNKEKRIKKLIIK